jgi:hypothetical protein
MLIAGARDTLAAMDYRKEIGGADASTRPAQWGNP